MSLLDYILNRRPSPAAVAKERLQIIISHERVQTRDDGDYLMKMQQEILDVISKYVPIDREQVKVQVERHGSNSILELNVTMPNKVIEAQAV